MSKPIQRPEAAIPAPPEQSGAFVLVGIPAYNEAETIREVVTAAQAHADAVLVVNDGSDDPTPQLATAAGARVISHDENRGYGATLRTIFQYADEMGVDHLVILDGDGQHEAADVPTLVRTQQETGAELVSGSRFTGESNSNMPRYRRVGLTVINLLTNLGLRIGYSYQSVSDSQCGFRVYNGDAIAKLAETGVIDSGMGASLDILFEAAREGYTIVEVPTRVEYDVADASTRNPVSHGLSLLKSLFVAVFRDRPLRVGSAVGAGLLAPLVAVVAVTRLGATLLSVLATVALTVVFVLGMTLLGRVSRRFGRTDQ